MPAEKLQGILFSPSQRLGELWKTCAQPVVMLRYAFLNNYFIINFECETFWKQKVALVFSPMSESMEGRLIRKFDSFGGHNKN